MTPPRIEIGAVCLSVDAIGQQGNEERPTCYVDISGAVVGIKAALTTREIPGRGVSQARQYRIVRAGDVVITTTRQGRSAVAVVPDSQDGQAASKKLCVLRPD